MNSFFGSRDTRNQAIVKYQREELEQLLADSTFVAAESRRVHYSKIGLWPGARAGSRVLELGCGPGRYAAILSTLGCRVFAADPHTFPTWTRIRERRPVQFISPVRAERLPFKDASFDAVACLGALLYFDDPGQAMCEIRRVLKPAGHLLIRTVNSGNLFARLRHRNIDPATRQVYSIDELLTLLESNGFSVSEHFSYGLYSPICPQFWWYLMNGPITISMQETLSNLTPAALRTNHVVFAQRHD